MSENINKNITAFKNYIKSSCFKEELSICEQYLTPTSILQAALFFDVNNIENLMTKFISIVLQKNVEEYKSKYSVEDIDTLKSELVKLFSI